MLNASNANTVNISAMPQRRRFSRYPNASMAAHSKHTNASTHAPGPVFHPTMFGRLRPAGATAEGAVVRKLIVAVAVPFAGIVIDVPELHEVSDGNPAHVGVTVTAPLLLNPPAAVNVSVVDPVCPGAVTGIVVGLALSENVGGEVIVSVIALALDEL
jgi:hypothetical protein